jgi:hypothetical protein
MSMDTFIEMYNYDQHTSWEDAAAHGGVYRCIVHSEDPLALEDAMEAAHTAALMMDGNCQIETRVVTKGEQA